MINLEEEEKHDSEDHDSSLKSEIIHKDEGEIDAEESKVPLQDKNQGRSSNEWSRLKDKELSFSNQHQNDDSYAYLNLK